MDIPAGDYQGEEEIDEEEAREAQLARLIPLLLSASARDDTDTVLSLLDEDADPTCEDYRQWSPLVWASNHGNEKLVRNLIDRECHLVYLPSFNLDGKKSRKHSPLHWASYKGHLRVVWLLLQQQLDPNDTDVLGNTCLHQAAAGGNLEVVRCLLGQGADLFQRNARGHNPFHLSTFLPVQKILKTCMDTQRCAVTGRIFSGGSTKRYLCSWSNAVCSKDGIVKSWTYPSETDTEKEMPLPLSKDSRDLVDVAEKHLKSALDSGKLEDALDAINNYSEGKPVDLRLLAEVKALRDRLESEIELREAINHKDIVSKEGQELMSLEKLHEANMRIAKSLETAIKKGADAKLITEGSNLKRRLLCETTLNRLLLSPVKHTLGYIKFVSEVIDTVIAENGNLFLIEQANAFRGKVSSEREIIIKYEEVYDLCLLKSITEAFPSELGTTHGSDGKEKNYPSWSIVDSEIEAFDSFHEQYVLDIENARENTADEELVKRSEEQIVILEELLVEKKSLIEEANLRKKKGKKGKK